MKILHVNTFDSTGGAAIAAYRLHRAFVTQGFQSSMLVANKNSGDFTVTEPSGIKHRMLHNFIPQVSKLITKSGRGHSIGLNWIPTGFHKSINATDADVVNLHWTNRDLLSIKEIAKINKPIVWTLHDMWSFCGTEGYAKADDNRYIKGYKSTDPVFELDWDVFTWNKKRRYWARKEIHIVTPSRWLGECAKKSVIWKNSEISVIPNTLDLTTFRPIDKDTARDLLKLPRDKKIILFGALFSTSDDRKGFSLLRQSMQYLSQTPLGKETEYVVFGANKPREDTGTEKIHYLGRIYDELTLALMYSAADVFVAPSKQENLANTIVEALACGLPTVAYNIGGMPDLIEHSINGYLATAYDTREFADCVYKIVSEDNLQKQMSVKSREKALQLFSYENVTKQYSSAYQDISGM